MKRLSVSFSSMRSFFGWIPETPPPLLHQQPKSPSTGPSSHSQNTTTLFATKNRKWGVYKSDVTIVPKYGLHSLPSSSFFNSLGTTPITVNFNNVYYRPFNWEPNHNHHLGTPQTTDLPSTGYWMLGVVGTPTHLQKPSGARFPKYSVSIAPVDRRDEITVEDRLGDVQPPHRALIDAFRVMVKDPFADIPQLRNLLVAKKSWKDGHVSLFEWDGDEGKESGIVSLGSCLSGQEELSAGSLVVVGFKLDHLVEEKIVGLGLEFVLTF
ncbi:hypothetical protein BCR33DRAFT_813025 [Rhizoclosmatium globosum]|uniref:Uncharacterized protein n=1 Tax=Rhizoclosmatium globosum TaxID=329046 RepID=A0A1Y2CGS1_9FUNG|nr:hypothetical protein BCR33DRAFT_813025 [Rhizoclosmatium globosum]|eukprot:ORY46117.1 hypothetical protein BCR33DRAFT_813025 [Rhizoclosmatium globosum]